MKIAHGVLIALGFLILGLVIWVLVDISKHQYPWSPINPIPVLAPVEIPILPFNLQLIKTYNNEQGSSYFFLYGTKLPKLTRGDHIRTVIARLTTTASPALQEVIKNMNDKTFIVQNVMDDGGIVVSTGPIPVAALKQQAGVAGWVFKESLLF